MVAPRAATATPEAPEVDVQLTAALDALRRILHAIRRSSSASERRAGVTGAQLLVLQVLRESPGCSVNELAARTFTHQSTVSVVVDRLVRGGLVHKHRSAADRRRVALWLTRRGRGLLRRSPESAHARLLDALRGMPHARVRQLRSLLEQVVAGMGATREPATLLFEDDGQRTTSGS